MEQRACDGILDGEHTDGCGILLDAVEDLFKGRTTYQLYLLPLEIQVCRDVVERPDQSLYGNSLHILLFHLFTFLPFHL
jgi:hypothetical protein